MFFSVHAHSLSSAWRNSDNPHDSFQSRERALMRFPPFIHSGISAVGRIGFSDDSSCDDLPRSVREVPYVQDTRFPRSFYFGSNGSYLQACEYCRATRTTNVHATLCLRADQVCCGVVVYALQHRKKDWLVAQLLRLQGCTSGSWEEPSTIEDAPHIPVK